MNLLPSSFSSLPPLGWGQSKQSLPPSLQSIRMTQYCIRMVKNASSEFRRPGFKSQPVF